MKVAFVGPLPFIVLALVVIFTSDHIGGKHLIAERIGMFVAALVSIIMCGGFYALLTGIVAGWIAHRFAFETAVPVSRLAIAIAWVANLSLWGWAVVVAMTDS